MALFYDHFFDWGLMKEIEDLAAVRRRNAISESSTVNIMASEADVYVAMVDQKIVVKIGPRYDVGSVIPPKFKVAACGKDYSVWERTA
ncbi:hypothetical protein Ancab_016333 [Ancistrocladus abbreviatus]